MGRREEAGMLIKMVYKNMDKKNMLLYSFSMILSVALETFFGAAFVVNGKYKLSEKAGNMDWLCTMFFLIAGAMSVFFTLYATGYYVRTKNKDFSLLLMLGSSRMFIFRFFAVEFLLIYAFSMILGISAGGIISVVLLAVLGLLQYGIAFSASDALAVLGTVVKINLLLFLLELPLLVLYFSKRDLSDMQLREVRKEQKHDRTCFLAIGGGGLIVCAMRLLRQDGLLEHLISMAVCLTGIYIVMSFGGSLILMLLKLFRRFYHRHIITLNEFYYRFKSNCRLLFIMLVLDFVILFFTGWSVISRMPEDADSPEYPYGFVGVMREGDSKVLLEEMIGKDRIELPAVMGYMNKEEIGLEERSFFCISDREYSRQTSHSMHLEAAQAVWVNQTTVLDMEKPNFLYLGDGSTLAVTEVRNEIIFGTEKPDCLREFVVLPEAVIAANQDNAYCIIAKRGNLQEEFERYESRFQGKDADVFWRYAFLRDADENMFFVKIISIFAGSFCLLSCFGIFALKIQGDMPASKRKYRILYHIGMSEKAIGKAMSAEYRRALEIPVAVSVVLSGVYMLAEMADKDMLIHYYICKYIPFQIIFICLNIAYFYWMKRIILQKNLDAVVNE